MQGAVVIGQPLVAGNLFFRALLRAVLGAVQFGSAGRSRKRP
jgi:hypothetical protein